MRRGEDMKGGGALHSHAPVRLNGGRLRHRCVIDQYANSIRVFT